MPKALLSCCLLFCFVVSASAQRQSVTPQLTTSLTVIPPAVATSQQLVDIRLGLANPSSQPQEVTVQFYASVLHPSTQIMPLPHTITLGPGTKVSVSAQWAPVAFHGPQTIIAVLSQPGLPEGQLRWPLYISPTPVSYFSAAWLEPGALGFLAYERITGQDIRALVRSYHARGITTIILGYVEYGGCLYYPSRVPVRWLDYTGCAFNTRTYWYDCRGRPKAMDPARPGGERCPWVANFDLIEMILAEADARGPSNVCVNCRVSMPTWPAGMPGQGNTCG